MTLSNTAIEVRPVAPALGAEIHGVDLARGLTDQQFDDVRDAFHRHGVIFFRDQDITPEQHIAFAERWGAINVNRFFQSVDGYPMIAEVRKEPHQETNIGGSWHTDHSYDTAPALGSILYALEVPPLGGDTLFAGMYAAYDALSDGMKAMLDGLRAVHSSRHVFGEDSYRGEGDIEGRTGNPDLATQDASTRSCCAIPTAGARRSTSTPASRCVLRVGRLRNPSRCSIISTNTRCGPSSSAASNGRPARSRFGTTGRLGTTPPTTTPASAA